MADIHMGYSYRNVVRINDYENGKSKGKEMTNLVEFPECSHLCWHCDGQNSPLGASAEKLENNNLRRRIIHSTDDARYEVSIDNWEYPQWVKLIIQYSYFSQLEDSVTHTVIDMNPEEAMLVANHLIELLNQYHTGILQDVKERQELI